MWTVVNRSEPAIHDFSMSAHPGARLPPLYHPTTSATGVQEYNPTAIGQPRPAGAFRLPSLIRFRNKS